MHLRASNKCNQCLLNILHWQDKINLLIFNDIKNISVAIDYNENCVSNVEIDV